ncbi:uncharacterized protein V6R79_015954 [Siganus canaliculatus]
MESRDMDIVKGSLEDISRPASTKLTGSRVSSVSLPHGHRISPSTSLSLLVLTKDAADIQSSSEDILINSSADLDEGQDADEENEGFKLLWAIEEMRRLDEVLFEKTRRLEEIRQQRKELRTKQWLEFLQSKPEGYSESAREALNTKLFLALEGPTEPEEEFDFVPVFETQIHDTRDQNLKPGEKRPNSLSESFEVGHEEVGEEQFESIHCGASKDKKKQKNIFKRNMERLSGEGDKVLSEQTVQERLAELLKDIEDEEEDCARGADSKEDMWAASVLPCQGYTPNPSQLEKLIDNDSKIRLLLSAYKFHAEQSSYPVFALSQGCGSDVGSKCDGDLQPGEKLLQDVKEWREQQRRLHEIDRQLEILGSGQDMTNEPPQVTEEQIHSLLDDDLTERWTQDPETNRATQ